MKRVLVTGASGFVGSHLVSLLHERGFEIWAGCHRHRRRFPFAVRWVPADLTRFEEALELVRQSRPDLVFHLAAQAIPSKSWEEPVHTLELNVAASIFLLEGIVRFAPKTRVVLISSAQVYGSTFFQKRKVSESDPSRPVSPYAGSKLLMEMAALNFVESHGLSIVIARAFNQIGPGQSPRYVFSDFCRQIALIEAGKRPPVLEVGNLEVVRDFIHVQDAARAYELLARRGRVGEIYNLGSGKGTKLGELVQFLKRESRVPFRVKRVPSRLQREEIPCAIADGSKLARLGWFSKQSVKETLTAVLNEWREKIRG